MNEVMKDAVLGRFQEGITLAARNRVLDAASAFREIVDRWPDHDLADDALYNLGACWLATNQFTRAIDTFRDVVRRYPDATIHDDDQSGERGRTAAKALLGLVAAHLGVGDMAKAREAAEKLDDYADSFVARPGITRTYSEIAQSLLQAAAGEDDRTADQVSPEDVVIVESDEEA